MFLLCLSANCHRWRVAKLVCVCVHWCVHECSNARYRRILSKQFHCFLLVIFIVNFWSERIVQRERRNILLLLGVCSQIWCKYLFANRFCQVANICLSPNDITPILMIDRQVILDACLPADTRHPRHQCRSFRRNKTKNAIPFRMNYYKGVIIK